MIPFAFGICLTYWFPVYAVGSSMYLTNSYSDTVSTIDVNANIVGAPIIVEDAPFGIAFDPANKRMYVTNQGRGNVTIINTNTNTLIGQPIPVGDTPLGIAFDSANKRMYIPNQRSHIVSVIDTNTNTVVRQILVGDNPFSIV
ncbi:MAG TPA: YncE family protein, partial [Nitrososphaeraceae archaeon]|nr:YncE family protein [Nitrososphaeraceae archaeon]